MSLVGAWNCILNNRQFTWIAQVLDGWDISKLNLADAMRRAQVLEVAVQDQVQDALAKMQPRPSIYDHDFIAANQVHKFVTAFLSNLRTESSTTTFGLFLLNLPFFSSTELTIASREHVSSNSRRFAAIFVTSKNAPKSTPSLSCGQPTRSVSLTFASV